jgi:putative hydrolase of the HAD superfamily
MYIYRMSSITTLLFDFGNVIIDIDIPGATSRLEALVQEGSDLPKARNHMKDLVIALETGKIPAEDFIGGMLGMSRPDVTPADVEEAWNSMLIGIPRYRLAMLEALKERYSVQMLSNINPLHMDWVHAHLRDSHGVTDFETRYFTGVYYSHLIGRRKPDADAFEFVIEDSFLTPENTLFIDDMPENIATARRLGFQTHLSPPEEEIAEYLKVNGYY